MIWKIILFIMNKLEEKWSNWNLNDILDKYAVEAE